MANVSMIQTSVLNFCAFHGEIEPDGSRPATNPIAMRIFFPLARTFRAFTLVELLIALSLSLILLLAMTELFSRVGGVMNDTRATLNLTTNLDGVEHMLRQDLARIPATLPTKPEKIANTESVSDLDGYLEIVEGPDTLLSYPLPHPLPDPPPHPYVNEDEQPDPTVGDVDDIFSFTAIAESGIPFRGIIDGQIAERTAADITWFVRGNTLYRRVRLIDDQAADTAEINSIDDLALRERRFGHDGAGAANANALSTFPYPLYDDEVNKGWSYLRMPTLEETLHDDWDVAQWRLESIDMTGLTAKPDLWTQPFFLSSSVQDRKSGSLKKYTNPRHHRAGEDIVLTNVLSFDIKVWDPETKDFVDLGAANTQWDLDNTADPTKPNHQKLLNVPKSSTQPKPWRTWDSWTQTYKQDDDTTVQPPPYNQPLTAVRFTIRCFDPANRGIKQISVIHKFDTP